MGIYSNIEDTEELSELLKVEEKESSKTLQELNIEKLNEYYKTKDEDLRNEIVTDNIRMVYRIAKDYSSKFHIPTEDLVQEGSIGLINAVENFDPSYNVMFSTFAFPYIKNKMNLYVQQIGHMISIPNNVQLSLNKLKQTIDSLTLKLEREPKDEEIAKAMGVEVDQVLEWKSYLDYKIMSDVKKDDYSSDKDGSINDIYPDSSQDPSKLAQDKELYEKVINLIESLPEKKRDICKRKYGIGCQKETLQNIAKDYNISLQRVAQIINEIDKELKDSLKDFLN